MLEQTFSYLKKQKRYKIKVERGKYEVTYYEVMEGLQVSAIPEQPYKYLRDCCAGGVIGDNDLVSAYC
ncbi:MAG: hypothetical protein ACI33P_13935 [Lysinibacillus sp.]